MQKRLPRATKLAQETQDRPAVPNFDNMIQEVQYHAGASYQDIAMTRILWPRQRWNCKQDVLAFFMNIRELGNQAQQARIMEAAIKALPARFIPLHILKKRTA